MFSVLISTYYKDSSVCLSKALNSIVNQSLLPNEIVIVIDGEIKEENKVVIENFQKAYSSSVKPIYLPQNLGLGNALNAGLQQCNYDLVARIDADDECFYNRFEKQIQFFENNPSVSIVGSYLQEFHETPNDYGAVKKAPLGINNIKKYAKYRNPLNHPSVMFKKSDIEAIGGYKEINLFEDYYLWLRALKAGFLIDNIPECLVHFKVGNDLIGRRHGWTYLKKELNFLRICQEQNLISLKSYYFQLLFRLPLRILPKWLLHSIYKKLLRN